MSGDNGLSRQSAGRRTPRDTFGADERLDCSLILVLTHDPDPFRGRLDRFRGVYRVITRVGFNLSRKGEYLQNIYV
jgi:hypothetical protein